MLKSAGTISIPPPRSIIIFRDTDGAVYYFTNSQDTGSDIQVITRTRGCTVGNFVDGSIQIYSRDGG